MMKTIKNMILVALLFCSLVCYAEKKDDRAISKLVMVEFVNVKKGHKLLVKDSYGIILHSETIDDSGNISKLFNLKNLKEGSYSVELEKDFEIIIKPFEVSNNVVVFEESLEKRVFKPSVRINEDRLLISQMTLDSQPIEIEIYYGDALIYSEQTHDENITHRVYKLSSFETGGYHTVLKIGARTYIKHFEI